MRRLLSCLFPIAALAIAAPAWAASTTANFNIGVTQSQAIASLGLSNSSFTGGAASGTVVGAISVVMAPATPAFSGTLSLTGANASNFQIVGANLETNGVIPAGSYAINIVATQLGVTGSPFVQAETITGNTRTATCPHGTTYPDGCAGASAGTPQLPSLLSSYGSNRPPWNVPGVDYHVGLPVGTVLADPSTAVLPLGCKYASNTVTCGGNNITISGYDFSLHGGLRLNISGSNNIITKNNFALSPNCQDPIIYVTTNSGGTLAITYNNFDGGGPACGTLDYGTMIFGIYANGSTVTLNYNYFYNTPQDLVDSAGPRSGSATLVEEYNLYNAEGWQGHPDGYQLNGGNFTGNVIGFNTFYNPYNPATGVQPLHVEAQLTAVVTNTTVSYNILVTPGTCNGGRTFPTGCTVNYDIACKQDTGWVDVNTGFSAYGNYIDWSGAVAALSNGYACTATTWGSPASNIDLKTGLALHP